MVPEHNRQPSTLLKCFHYCSWGSWRSSIMGRSRKGNARDMSLDQCCYTWIRQPRWKKRNLFWQCAGLFTTLDSSSPWIKGYKVHLRRTFPWQYFSSLLYQPLSLICQRVHKYNWNCEFVVCRADDFLSSNCREVWLWSWSKQKCSFPTAGKGRIPGKVKQFVFGRNKGCSVWSCTLSKTDRHRNGRIHKSYRFIEAGL